LVWLNGSDNPPPAEVESAYLAIESDLKWPCPTLSSASAAKTTVTGTSGVKMEGPYKWEPPIFWTTDTKTGGAWGFNTEVGPGAVPPPLETLEKIIPPDHRWPIDAVWNFHCGANEFKNFDDFTKALEARYGKCAGIADFSWKAQAQAYETIRAMYEGFRANKWKATGEIQWMLNNAWPSMIWHLYDYYFRAGGAYFATKLGCEPLHVLYRYDNQQIVIANDTLNSYGQLRATAEAYNLKGELLHSQEANCAAPANVPTVAFALPPFTDGETSHFLRLKLFDRSRNDAPVSVNSYWISAKPDVLDFDNPEWFVTHCTSFADHTALEKLPPVTLTLDNFVVKHEGGEDSAVVSVPNTPQAVAMMVRLKITKDAGGEELLPIRWEDNYFMLLPGEQRPISARWLSGDLQGKSPAISVDCFNNGRA
jgi:exo-1,4-beta-D-glucosaminidase